MAVNNRAIPHFTAQNAHGAGKTIITVKSGNIHLPLDLAHNKTMKQAIVNKEKQAIVNTMKQAIVNVPKRKWDPR